MSGPPNKKGAVEQALDQRLLDLRARLIAEVEREIGQPLSPASHAVCERALGQLLLVIAKEMPRAQPAPPSGSDRRFKSAFTRSGGVGKKYTGRD